MKKKKEKPMTALEAITKAIKLLKEEQDYVWDEQLFDKITIKTLRKHQAYLKREQKRKKNNPIIKAYKPVKESNVQTLSQTEFNTTFPEKRKTIILNRAQCLNCKQVITSRFRNDFQTCKCGRLSVDGGLQYLKRNHSGAFKEMSVTI